MKRITNFILGATLALNISYNNSIAEEILISEDIPPHLLDLNNKSIKSLKPDVNISKLEKQIHNFINEERKRNRLSLLDWNDELNSIAKKHSKDMADRGYFGHKSPEGHNSLDRYKQDNFACEIIVGDSIYGGAENIYKNSLFNSILVLNEIPYYFWNTQEEIAASTVKGWMNSPGHRKNIIIPFWKSEGIGIFISQNGNVYITQNFC